MSVSKSVKKFTRGTLGFIALKFCLVAIFLFVQACSESTEPEDPMARFDKFLKQQSSILTKAAMNSKRGTVSGSLQLQSSDPIVQQVMNDTYYESQVFLTSFGFAETELREELGEFYEVGIIYTAMAAFEAEREWGSSGSGTNGPGVDMPDVASIVFGINTIQAEESIGTCLLEAVGVGALYDWAVGKAVLSRRLLIRAVGKFLARSLGWVGTALAVADFVWCMNRE